MFSTYLVVRVTDARLRVNVKGAIAQVIRYVSKAYAFVTLPIASVGGGDGVILIDAFIAKHVPGCRIRENVRVRRDAFRRKGR